MNQGRPQGPNPLRSQPWSVDGLIEAIVAKLKTNRATLEKSLGFGRLTWRQKKDGNVEIDLEPKL